VADGQDFLSQIVGTFNEEQGPQKTTQTKTGRYGKRQNLRKTDEIWVDVGDGGVDTDAGLNGNVGHG
jgi:hypothetical protein